MRGACRVCRVCDGVVCAGEMPGMGGVGTGSSFMANIQALAEYKLALRTMHDVTAPEVAVNLFGHDLETPILGAAVAGTQINMNCALTEAELAEALIGGCASAGSLGMVGDGPSPEVYQAGLEALASVQGRGIAIIKPRPKDEIIARIRQAEAAGAWAVGVDIDAAGIINMTRAGQPVGPHPPEVWQEIIGETTLPFVFKGIMTVEEAELAVDAGAQGIVVSNHGGRILDSLPGTAEVLPDIADAVGGDVTVLVDGGVRSGVDVLKMLALGAHAVLVGRPLAIAAVGGPERSRTRGSAEAVTALLARFTDELRSAMILTGCASLPDIDEAVLYG